MTRDEDEVRVINGAEPEVAPAVTPEDAALYQTAILEALPGLIGGIDQALREQMGHPVAFVLMTFGKGGAAYSTNVSDVASMQAAVTGIVVSWSGGCRHGSHHQLRPPCA